MARPITSTQLRRSETEYSRQRKQFDSNPRFRYDNIINLDMEMPEKTTQDFEGPGMVSKVDNVLGMNLHATDDDEVNIANEANNGLANPYMQYPGGNANEPAEDVKPKKKKSSSAGGERERERGSGASRPKSAARKSGNRDEK
jgi:kinesin family member 3B